MSTSHAFASLLIWPLLLTVTPIAKAGADIEPDWSVYPGFYSPGTFGIVAADLDGDGQQEAVISGSADSSLDVPGHAVMAVVKRRNDDGFQVRHLRRFASGEFPIGSMVAYQLASGESRIVSVIYGDSNNRLVQYAGPKLVEVSSILIPSGFRLNAIGDIDGIPGLEAIGCACSNYETGPAQMLDLDDGSVLWTGTTPGRYTRAGQLDADPQWEIVVSGTLANAGQVLDGATRQLQWSWPDGFNGTVAIGNFRTESTGNELAVVDSWGFTTVYVTQPVFSPISQIPTGEVQAVTTADLNGDGMDELVTGAGQWGSIRAYTMQTGQVLHSVPNPEHGTSGLALAKMGPGTNWQVVHGAGLTSGGKDIARIADLSTATELWNRADEAGPHSSVAMGPISSSGAVEAVYLTLYSDSRYGGHNLVVVDPDTGRELRRRRSVLEPWGSNQGAQVLIAQLDTDLQNEILVGSTQIYDARLRAVDGDSLETQWTSPPLQVTNGDGFDAATLLPGTPFPQIIAASGGRLSFLSPADGSILTQSIQFARDGKQTLLVANMDADPALEIAFGTGSLIRILDAESRLVEATVNAGAPIIGQRIEGSGDRCRHVLVFANRLERRLCMSGILDTTRVFTIDSANYVGFPTNSNGALVISDGSRVMLELDGQIIGQSAHLGSGVGWRNRGVLSQSGDGVNVLIGGLDSVHAVALTPRVFADSFED